MPQSILRKILVIGGTGHFGGRICRRLVSESAIELLVSSRSLAEAQVLVDELHALRPSARITAVALDQASHDFESELAALKPFVVVHTAGPYQGQDYRVAEACIRAGSHYVDLADGRAFVQGFDALNDAAQHNQLLLVSGASTLPGVSSVVIESLRERFDALQDIEISIAPAHQTPRGASTVAAVLSYCGKSFPILLDGEMATQHGWQNLKWLRYPGFGTRIGAACDVPDLALLPNSMHGLRSVTFHAALEAKWEQAALWLMAWMTRAGLVRDWRRVVPLFRTISDRLIGFGSDTGGMQIRLSGLAADKKRRTITWDLIAYSNHGPEIPCSPALILVRKLIADQIATRGAIPCLAQFSMADLEQELAQFNVHWNVCTE